MPKKLINCDENGKPYKLVNAKDGKTWHQAFLLEGGTNTPTCKIRWITNDEEKIVKSNKIDFKSSWRGSRRQCRMNEREQ